MRRSEGGKNPICYNLSAGAKHGLIHFNVTAKHCSESRPFPVFPASAEPDVHAESEIPESIFFTPGESMEDLELLCTTIHIHLGIGVMTLTRLCLLSGKRVQQRNIKLLRWWGGLSFMPRHWGKFLLYWMTGKSPNTPNEGKHHSIYYQRGRNKALLDAWGCSILHYNMEPWHRGRLLKRLDLSRIVGLRFAGPKLKLAITLSASPPLF